MSENIIYLVKVEVGENNNKYYRMTPDSNGSTFTVEYGRIGNPKANVFTYDMGEWSKKLNEKLRKGYVNQTHLIKEVKVSKGSTYKEITETRIREIVERLQRMAKQAIEDNYTVSASGVTQRMIDEAQSLINDFSNALDVDTFNRKLVDLFRIIPRKMKKVVENLADNKSNFAEIIQREQDLLDVMKTQVQQDDIVVDVKDERKTILESLGLVFADTTRDEVSKIKSLLGDIGHKYSNSWKVENNKTQKVFNDFIKSNKIKNVKNLWHGSRNENWWSIINTGLVLRPNAVITGKMFGNGIYFAPKAGKSLGYTSLNGSYWAGGNSNSAFMSVYDVAYGTPYDVYSFDSKYHNFNYNKLQQVKQDANCLHAHSGNMLRNDEIIVYKEEQLTIKYLVELKN